MKVTLKQIRIATPFAFWAFQIIIHIIRNIYVLQEHSFLSLFAVIKITFPLDFITFSVFYFFIAPRIFKRQKIGLSVVLSLVYFFFYGFVWAFIYRLNGTPGDRLNVIYLSSMGHSLLYAFYGIVIRMALDWFEKRDTQKELEKQHIKTELALLRSQINPHFLFNTLNNINSFAQTEPEKTSYAIIKLSEIMRYMLYESKGERVLISQEIRYIQDYLDLQKLRFATKNFVELEMGEIPPSILIPPLLFIPFIENAFKHGKKSNESKITIQLHYANNELFFTCKNKKRPLNETEKSSAKGIGIENIKRRLTLLYPQKHELEIVNTETDFNVRLKLILS